MTPAVVRSKVRQLATFLDADEAKKANSAGNLQGTSNTNVVSQKDYETFRQMIGNASEQVEQQSNKVALGWKSMRNDEERHGLLQALMQQAELVFTCTFLMTTSQGLCCAAARDEITYAAKQISASIDVMMELLERSDAIDKQAFMPEIAQKCGAVWEACKGVRLVAKSNRAATKRKLMRSIRTIKDTHDEFEDMVKNARERDSSATNNDDDDDDVNTGNSANISGGEPEIGSDEWYAMMDELGEEESMDETDCERVENGLEVVRTTGRVLQNAAKTVGSVEPWRGDNEKISYVSWLDQIAIAASQIEKAITQLGVNMYPPLDEDVIINTTQNVRAASKGLIDAINSASVPLAEPDTKALDDLQATLSSMKI